MATESTGPRSWHRRVDGGAPGGPLVLGHRGASAHLTENTLAAFHRAMADGADGVELDVQRCRSGDVVVFHDDDLLRLTGSPGRIVDLPLPALRERRLLAGGTVPTLAEVLEACGPHALVNVELKVEGVLPAGCRALVASVAKAVARAGAAPRVLVSSFNPAAVWLWRRHNPLVPCGLLFERPRRFHRPWPFRTDFLLPVLAPAAVHPDHALCTAEAVGRWHRRHFAVNAWTVDDPVRIRALAEMGVDAIITNDPAAARAALRLTVRSEAG